MTVTTILVPSTRTNDPESAADSADPPTFTLPPGVASCNSTTYLPNPCVSNFPSVTTGNWAFYFAIIYFIFLTSFVIFLVYRLVRYRTTFPVSLLYVPVYAAMASVTPVTFLAYTHSLLIPSMPCWLHLLLGNWQYLVPAGLAFSITFRAFIQYNGQYALEKGDFNSWFIRNKDILKGMKFDLFVVAVTAIISCFGMLTRFLQDPEKLTLTVSDVRCSSMTTGQFVARILNGYLVLGLMKKVADLVKDVKESYPLRRLYTRVTGINKRVYLFIELPLWIKQFTPNLVNHAQLFYDLAAFSQLIFAIVFCTNYLYNLPYTVTQSAHNIATKRLSATHLSRGSLQSKSSGRAAGEDGDEDVEIPQAKVNNASELKEMLQGNTPLQNKFKKYLVREFAVENMLFIMQLELYRNEIANNPNQAVEFVQKTCDTYVKEGANLQINVSAGARLETLRNAQSAIAETKDGRLPLTIFDKMEQEVFKMLVDPFGRFQHKSKAHQGGGGAAKKVGPSAEEEGGSPAEVKAKLSVVRGKMSKVSPPIIGDTSGS